MTFSFQGETITVVGRGHYLIESWTSPGEHHSVDLEEGTCSCKGYQCTNNCRHLKVLKRALCKRENSPQQPP